MSLDRSAPLPTFCFTCVRSGRLRGMACVLIALLTLGLTALPGCGASDAPEPLVVYCAHDQLYAEAILERFEEETGIPVEVRFDTEATKSLGLTELIIREAEHPRCDVFWNNQLLGTADLAERGLLQPYKGEGWQRIPAGLKDPEGRYVGFGARLRVYIVNTERMPATEEAVQQRLAGGDLSRVALAKPLYGTTLTHMAVLWDAWGGEKVQAWHEEALRRGLIVQGGNATTKNLVAAGTCDLGFTDTDDFFVGKDAGALVDMVPVRVDDGRTICIPNTVAIIRRTDQPLEAQRLVDFLTSEAIELALAHSKARQIPLGPVDEAELPDDVKQLKQWTQNAYPLDGLVDDRAAALAWLKTEYLE